MAEMSLLGAFILRIRCGPRRLVPAQEGDCWRHNLLFGLLMLSGRRVCTLAPAGEASLEGRKLEDLTAWSVSLMEIGRGLPLCPFELIVALRRLGTFARLKAGSAL